MQVALISTYPPTTCGIASYSHHLTAALRATDPSVRVAVVTELDTTSADPDVWPSFDRDGEYVAPILDGVENLDADLVHIQHEYGVFGLDERFHELLAGLRRAGRPVVVTQHTVHTTLSMDLGCSWRGRRPPPSDLDIERYQREVGAAVDAVVVHQETAIRQVLLRQGLAENRVVTIPHGTPIATPPDKAAARAALGLPLDEPLLLAFGFFEPAKNHAVLIEALSLLRADVPSAKLVIGGHIRYPAPETVAYRALCEQLVERLGLGDHVTFLDDPVPDDEIVTLLGAADVACFAYDEDTLSSSGALRWAVGCGVPVVASRVAKFSELSQISDELLVNPRSPAQVARLVGRILSDSSFRTDMRRRGDRFADATSWDRVARRHLALYRDIAALAASRTAPLPRVEPHAAAVVA